jgi:hypothetical protein
MLHVGAWQVQITSLARAEKLPQCITGVSQQQTIVSKPLPVDENPEFSR